MAMHTRKEDRSPEGEGFGNDPFDEQDFSHVLESMTVEAKAYWTAQKDYYALVASERAAKLSANMLGGVLLGVFTGVAMAFLSVAAAIRIGHGLGDMALGFLVMGGAYLLLGLIFLLIWRSGYRDKFILRMVNSIYHG